MKDSEEKKRITTNKEVRSADEKTRAMFEGAEVVHEKQPNVTSTSVYFLHYTATACIFFFFFVAKRVEKYAIHVLNSL